MGWSTFGLTSGHFWIIVNTFQPMNEYKQTWLFQANSMVWIGFSEQFKQNTVGATGDWTVSRYWKEIDSGDRVLLWEVGSNARLLAIGELTGKPFEGKVPFLLPTS